MHISITVRLCESCEYGTNYRCSIVVIDDQWIAASIGCAPDEMTQEQLVDFGLGLSANDDATARLVDWCTGVYHCDEAVQFRQWPVFWQPSKVTDWRVSVTKNADFTRFESANQHLISRDQFTLTPTYWDRDQSMIHVDYCRYCHDRSVDYYRTGFLQKGDQSQGFREDSSGRCYRVALMKTLRCTV